MHDLKCGQTDCEHNLGYCCCANAIAVTDDAVCATYCRCSGDKLIEAAHDYPNPKNNVDTNVACNAECIFNKSTRCIANGITVAISEDGKNAECLTFVKS